MNTATVLRGTHQACHLTQARQPVLRTPKHRGACEQSRYTRPFVALVHGSARKDVVADALKVNDYETIARSFIEALAVSFGIMDLPKTRADLHARYEGVFRRWAEAMRINTKIYHLVLSGYEKLVQIKNKEKELELKISSLPQKVQSNRFQKKMIDGVPVGKFHAHFVLHGAGDDKAEDSLDVVIHQREHNTEEISPCFHVCKDTYPQKKKGVIAGFILHGIQGILRDQGYKKSSISLEHLIKRFIRYHKEKGTPIDLGEYENKLLAVAKKQQLVWWIPK